MALFEARGRINVRRKHRMKTRKNNGRGREMLLTLITAPHLTRGEPDFVAVIQEMINQGHAVYGMELAGAYLNINSPDDLITAESLLRTKRMPTGLDRKRAKPQGYLSRPQGSAHIRQRTSARPRATA